MTAARNESITEIGRACLASFAQLTTALTEAAAENRDSMPADKLEGQFGRFKIWCGNLGALQRGKSSLDARLRESTIIRTNVLKHLARLNQTLLKSTEITSGARIPLEKQHSLEDLSDNSSSGESEEDDEPPKELTLHMVMIKEILNDLYMLSFRIRNNSARPTSTLRIKLYSEVDDQTGIDKFAAYTEFDKRHVEDSLLQLRQDAAIEMNKKPSEIAQITDSDQYLINRLVTAMNKRRKVLRYWRRHAKKIAEMPEEVKEALGPQSIPKLQAGMIEAPSKTSSPGRQVQLGVPSVTENTMLSNTEATRFDKTLDVLETQSVISYASKIVDVHDNEVDLPLPPTAASTGSEFLCPYCGIVCPARHGKSRAWRAHILHDLQPYICTYEKCEHGEQLFSSRAAWLEHERLGHRRVWHCFEHAESNFWTQGALQHHLESEHSKDITEMQIQNLVEVSELSTVDTRTTCPFCLLEGPLLNGLESHMAFHLQKFAAFSVPRDLSAHNDDDVRANDDQSGCAQGLGSQGSQVSGPPQFDSRPPSRASDDDKLAFWSPPSSIWDEPEPAAIFTVPFRRDPDFFDHGNILEQIYQRCSQPGGRAALTGLGGAGKSQRAIEYAYRARQRSPETLIFWIHAGNTARFEQCYRDIADAVNIAGRDNPNSNVFKLVRDWLRENHGKWLIILDDVADAKFLLESKLSSRTEGSNPDYQLSESLRNYLPQTPNGSILITTRSRKVALSLVEPKDVIPVLLMNEVRALKVFEQNIKPGLQRNNEDEVELVAALQFLPLAIAQAAAYISQRAPRYSVRNYIEVLKRRENHEAEKSIITTCQISFDHIRQLRPTAASLLSLMSFFESQGIPEALVRNQPLESEDYNKNKNDGEAIGDNDSFFRTNEGGEFDEDVLMLRNYSLITIINADAQVFKMHKFVQQATQKWLEANNELEQFRGQYIRNLYVEFPTGVYENWEKCQMLFPHAQSAISQRPQHEDSLLLWASILHDGAWYAWERGNVTSAEKMAVEALKARKELLGQENKETLSSMSLVGLVFYMTGRRDEAEKLEMQALDGRKKVLGEEHPDTLASIANLALTYRNQGRSNEAEKLEVQVLDARKKVLGEEHPDTLDSIADLASTYWNQGRWKEAEELDVQAFDARKKVLGEEHPDTVTSMNNLARTWEGQGRVKEAIALMRECVRLRKHFFGPQHPFTSSSRTTLIEWEKSQEHMEFVKD